MIEKCYHRAGEEQERGEVIISEKYIIFMC